MTLTAELSLYPLDEDYIPVIQSFIDGLNKRADLQVVTNAMSTQIQGEHEAVMSAVSDTLLASYEQHGSRQVLVCKFIPMALDIG
ncbi:YkoF family thiamine/hydroxymethylpyrimidine-binding protein [Congregibacter variabilis]|uniref:YkoF family thiamine/hydroxymethylpyrimidine-binding protein n=1 Tax=Congregibacter variabilis TaxID=3081200 RepID=A0ABZ0I1E8_9GAMM|nr:YkoF family thiamine/hydroxymethylpyrimidine-binding protein [Congregibacter sp. IMCC43200]